MKFSKNNNNNSNLNKFYIYIYKIYETIKEELFDITNQKKRYS